MAQTALDDRQLSVAERIQLVEDIWDSIVAEAPQAVALSGAQMEEVERRLRAHDQDPSTSIPWETVRAELFDRRG